MDERDVRRLLDLSFLRRTTVHRTVLRDFSNAAPRITPALSRRIYRRLPIGIDCSGRVTHHPEVAPFAFKLTENVHAGDWKRGGQESASRWSCPQIAPDHLERRCVPIQSTITQCGTTSIH